MTEKPGSGGEGPDVQTDAASGENEAPPAWWDMTGLHLAGEDYQAVRPPAPADGPDAAEPAGNEDDGGGLVGHLQSVAEPVANVIGSVLGAASDALSGEAPARARRLRRLNRAPLANLYGMHPEARDASPREFGLRFVPIEDIRGTAVAGIAQRGGDFLPLKPFRGRNWEARWDRIRQAHTRLESLPPVDLVKYGGEYWVLDGHNRVAATLYANGVGLDAMVTELVPLDGHASERPTGLLSMFGEAGAMRLAAQGLTPAVGMRASEMAAKGPTEVSGGAGATDRGADGEPRGRTRPRSQAADAKQARPDDGGRGRR